MACAETTVAEIVAACESMQGLPYDGEPVDQLEHALQCAQIAAAEHGGDGEFVAVPGLDVYRPTLLAVAGEPGA